MDMEGTISNYGRYQTMGFLLPLGILVGILIFGLALMIITPIVKCCCTSKCCCCFKVCCCTQFLTDGLRDLMLRTMKFLMYEFEHKKEGKEHKYFLYGVEVHLVVLQYLFIVLLNLIIAALISFWNTFLAEATIDQCDPTATCFPTRRRSFFIRSDRAPITNCADFPINNEETVVCFREVYRYSEGLGEAGGFLFSMQLVINSLVYVIVRMVRVVLKIVKVIRYKTSRKTDISNGCVYFWSYSAKFTTIFFVLVSYAAALVLLPLWLLNLSTSFIQTLMTPQRQLQLFIYEYTMFVFLLVPWIVGLGIYDKKLYRSIDIKYYTNGEEDHSESVETPNEIEAPSENSLNTIDSNA